MKRIITTAFATLVAVYGYSQTNTFPSDGNVGIGTLTPDNAQNWNRVLNLHGTNHAKLMVTESSGVKIGIYSHNGYNGKIGTESNHNLTFTVGYWNDVMTLTTQGNAGIGTITPEARLDVKSGAFIVDTENNGYGGLKIETSSAGDYNVNLRAGRGGPADGFRFYTNARPMNGGPFSTGNLRMTLTGTGNLGIGTAAPNEKLELTGNIRINSRNTGTTGEIDAISFQKQHTSAGEGYNYVLGEIRSFTEGGYSGGLNFYTGRHTGGGNYASTFAMTINNMGNVGIGTTDPQGYKLAVAGKIHATEVQIEVLPWPDYVFHSSYKLPDLKDTEQFIKENKHLPEIPSAAEVVKNGIKLGEMNAKLLQKIEELTLYLIEQSKDNKEQAKQIAILQQEVKLLKDTK